MQSKIGNPVQGYYNMSTRRINLREIHMIDHDLMKLHRLAMSSANFVRHDVYQPLSTLMGYCSLLPRLANGLEDRPELKDKLKAYGNEIQAAADRVTHVLDMYINEYSSKDSDSIFVAEPFAIISKIKEDIFKKTHVNQEFIAPENTELTIGRASPKTLVIVFPSNVLSGIMKELVRNAIKSNGNERIKMLINWRIESNKFIGEIHDNGPGIAENLTSSFLPVDVLSIKQRGFGLKIIMRLLSESDGHLFFARSKRLGGSLAYFDFPVIAYYMRGVLHEVTK